MDLDLPPTIALPERISTHDALALKSAIVRGLPECTPDWNLKNPPVGAAMRAELTITQVEFLLAANVIGVRDGALVWNFRPFFGNGLLLIRDLEYRRFLREFIWLHTEVDSGSWHLPESVEVQRGMKVLDLGCGSGLNALRCAARGAHSTGVDINPRAVAAANFNRALNGLDTARFVHSDWNAFQRFDYDLVISQPPFDPVLPGANPAFAFGGGEHFGLEYTLDLVARFQPTRAHQRMQLYVHTFTEQGMSLLDRSLGPLLPPGLSFSTGVRKSHSIDDWWKKYKDRHNLPLHRELPKEWDRFDSVRACFISIRMAETPSRSIHSRRTIRSAPVPPDRP